jgi:hypothetical protein
VPDKVCLDQRKEIGSVFSFGGLPVDVDPVEEPGLVHAGREMSVEERVDTGGNERLAVFWQRVLGEVRCLALKRDEDFQVLITKLEFFELVKIAAETGGAAVGFAVDAVVPVEANAEIGIGIGKGTVAVAHRALGVVDLVELVDRVIDDKGFDVERMREAETALGEISDHQGVRRVGRWILRQAVCQAGEQNCCDTQEPKPVCVEH